MTCISKSTIWRSSGVLLMLAFGPRASTAEPRCGATPQLAIALYLTGTTAAANERSSDQACYRVTREQTDEVSGQLWGWVVDARLPQRPARLLRLPAGPAVQSPGGAMHVPQPTAAPIEIRPGDPVIVIEQSQSLRMRIAGRALEQARHGEQVHVRIAALDGMAVVLGIVSGRGEVRLP